MSRDQAKNESMCKETKKLGEQRVEVCNNGERVCEKGPIPWSSRCKKAPNTYKNNEDNGFLLEISPDANGKNKFIVRSLQFVSLYNGTCEDEDRKNKQIETLCIYCY